MPNTPIITGVEDQEGEPSIPLPSSLDDLASQSRIKSWSGAPPAPPEDPLLGMTLSATYAIERMIGEGGMGRVYEARHTRIRGKRFAVKVLHSEYVRQTQVRTRFYREAEAAALISNPHVVGVYDVGEAPDGRPFLVAEFLDGKELGEQLDAVGSLPVATTVYIVRQICRALEAAHAEGVIHRDIKPENVFLTGPPERPVVKVLDFGISRLEDKSGATLTKTGMIMGTPAYMAPEQARGEKVDHRADLYAVGAILYRALTGALPFDKDDPGATVVAVLTEEPARPRAIDPSIPEPLELVIQKAMAKKPDERFQSMAELDAALAPFDVAGLGDAEEGHTGLSPRPGAVGPAQRAAAAAKTTVGQQVSELQLARPMLGVLLGLGAFAFVASLASAIGAVIRIARGGLAAQITGTEAALVLLAVVCTLATPAVLLVRHLKGTIWTNTAKVVTLLERVRTPLLLAAATYGLAALLLRAAEVLLVGQAVGLAWPAWDVVLFLLALGGASAGEVTRWLQRRNRVQSAWDRLAVWALGGAVGIVVILALLALRGTPAPIGTTDPVGSASASGAAASTAGSSAPTAATSADSEDGAPKPLDVSAGLEFRRLLGDFKKQIGRGELAEAIATLEQLVALNPDTGKDAEARADIMTLVIRASMLPDRPEATQVLDVLTNKMGTPGIDILYEMYTTRGGTAASREAGRLLADEQVRARGSPALRIAWALRAAKSCEEKIALFDQAKRDGDRRAVTELQILKSCNRRSPQSCCLRDDDRVKEAIATIEARVR